MPDTLFTFVVCCFVCAAAQFNGIQNFQLNGGRTNVDQQRQLSPQQQGHILSDIQQHQHRFQLHQSLLKAQEQQKPINFGPQNVFQQPFSNQQGLNPTPQFSGSAVSGPDHPESLLQPQLPLVHQNLQFNSHTNGQPSLLNPQFLSQAPQNNLQTLTSSVSTPLANQFLKGPTQSSVNLQQGGFQNNFLQQPVQVQPTSNPVNTITNIPSSPNPVAQNNEQNNFFDSSEAHQQRLKELRLKQQIIDKHNQFVEKQYEKALKKAQDEHQDWLENQREQRKKLYQSLYRPGGPRILNYSGPRPRLIFPEESSLFQQAVDKYYQEHPTTTTTTTTTTTEAPTTKTIATTRRSKKIDLSEDDEDPELYLPNNRQSLFGELKSTVQREIEPGNKEQFLPTAIPEAKAKPIKSIEQLDLLQKQYQQQLLQRDDLLAQLRKAIAETPEDDPANKNFTSREISLPNGQTVQIIKTTDPKLIPGATPITSESIAAPKVVKAIVPASTTTAKPPKELLEELTQGVLPPGADFEVIKHDANGGLQGLGELPSNLPNQKKVTFVLLEEQQDGSYKVQGVKGNANDKNEKETVDVDSILNKIKSGELKLPPPTRSSISNEVTSTPYSVTDIKAQSTAYPTPSQASRSTISFQSTNSSPKPQVQILTNSNADSVISSSINGKQFAPSSTQTSFKSSTALPYSQKYASTTPTTLPSSKFLPQQALLPTVQSKFQSQPPFFPSSTEHVRLASATTNSQKSPFPVLYASSTLRPNSPKPTQQSTVTILQSQPSSVQPLATDSTAYADDDFTFSTTQSSLPLTELFKKKGLFAMSKFLKQSGLDTILNETGPYTIFVPSDKAFRNLLIQLGGPEKAEEKFKENPRLLSGLLLHHVIPGAFEIKHLQDEMTGVSLAGTQLRVNQYAMQDVEWNEVKVTTINGAKIMDDKQDISIPQGIAHTVDRVMFPLPVGDIVQTLQSDRERRFTTFLRILFASGLVDTLQGTKTFTVFAPVDRAFTALSSEQLTHTVTDRAVAREFIMRHIIPGTLYTSGMRYYQIKDSLQPDKQITINKTTGRIKVNNVNIITQNVPTTNGVIHAMESLL